MSGAHTLDLSLRPGVRLVDAPDWEHGPGASLRCRPRGARRRRSSHAVVVLADGPALDPRAVERVLRAARHAARSSPRATTAPGATRSCSPARSGRPCPTTAGARSSPCSSTAPTWSRPATSTTRATLGERRAQRGQLRLQRRRHRLGDGDAHVVAEALLEPVALRAPAARLEMLLRLRDLVRRTACRRGTAASSPRTCRTSRSRRHRLVSEVLLENTPSPVQAGHHGPDRDVEDLGGVGVARTRRCRRARSRRGSRAAPRRARRRSSPGESRSSTRSSSGFSSGADASSRL